MKIYFERSGGFMGRSISTIVDTNQLPPDDALKLITIIDETDFFDLPENLGQGLESTPMGADQLCYRVTVEVAGVQHTVETSDLAAPEELQPLLTELSQLARTMPG